MHTGRLRSLLFEIKIHFQAMQAWLGICYQMTFIPFEWLTDFPMRPGQEDSVMGFCASDLLIFKDVFADASIKARAQTNVLSLGYADVIISDATYFKYFRRLDWKAILKGRDNREKLLKIHGGKPELISVVPTLESFFALYGDVKVDVLDFAQYEGSEIIQDLNDPVSEDLVEKYDLVIDGGATEHVFDIARALVNCARMTKVGGFVYHAVPMNMLNHGFYNFSPTLLCDFYEDNGFETVKCLGVASGVREDMVPFELPPVQRFNLNGGEACMLYLARRVEARDVFVKPIQRKYRDIDVWR
ncbi:MAG: hypothetical protein ACOH12_14555 [Parvibaculaceae bacterium]